MNNLILQIQNATNRIGESLRPVAFKNVQPFNTRKMGFPNPNAPLRKPQETIITVIPINNNISKIREEKALNTSKIQLVDTKAIIEADINTPENQAMLRQLKSLLLKIKDNVETGAFYGKVINDMYSVMEIIDKHSYKFKTETLQQNIDFITQLLTLLKSKSTKQAVGISNVNTLNLLQLLIKLLERCVKILKLMLKNANETTANKKIILQNFYSSDKFQKVDDGIIKKLVQDQNDIAETKDNLTKQKQAQQQNILDALQKIESRLRNPDIEAPAEEPVRGLEYAPAEEPVYDPVLGEAKTEEMSEADMRRETSRRLTEIFRDVERITGKKLDDPEEVKPDLKYIRMLIFSCINKYASYQPSLVDVQNIEDNYLFKDADKKTLTDDELFETAYELADFYQNNERTNASDAIDDYYLQAVNYNKKSIANKLGKIDIDVDAENEALKIFEYEMDKLFSSRGYSVYDVGEEFKKYPDDFLRQFTLRAYIENLKIENEAVEDYDNKIDALKSRLTDLYGEVPEDEVLTLLFSEYKDETPETIQEEKKSNLTKKLREASKIIDELSDKFSFEECLKAIEGSLTDNTITVDEPIERETTDEPRILDESTTWFEYVIDKLSMNKEYPDSGAGGLLKLLKDSGTLSDIGFSKLQEKPARYKRYYVKGDVIESSITKTAPNFDSIIKNIRSFASSVSFEFKLGKSKGKDKTATFTINRFDNPDFTKTENNLDESYIMENVDDIYGGQEYVPNIFLTKNNKQKAQQFQNQLFKLLREKKASKMTVTN